MKRLGIVEWVWMVQEIMATKGGEALKSHLLLMVWGTFATLGGAERDMLHRCGARNLVVNKERPN